MAFLLLYLADKGNGTCSVQYNITDSNTPSIQGTFHSINIIEKLELCLKKTRVYKHTVYPLFKHLLNSTQLTKIHCDSWVFTLNKIIN